MAVTTSEPPPASSLPIIRLAALRLTLIALVLGLCANVLFVNHPLGLNFPLFTLWTLAALLTLAALERVRPAWRNLWLAAPLIYFAAMTAVRAEPFVTFLNVCTALGLAMLLAHLFASGSLATFGVWDYVTAPMLTSVDAGVVRPGLVLIAARTEAVRPGGASPRALAVLRGLVLAIPVVIVFTMLLTSADVAFNKLILDTLRVFSLDDLPELMLRLIVIGLVGWACLGGLAYALRDTLVPEGIEAKSNSAPLGFIEAAIVLSSVNLLFVAFVATQFRYFFGGQSNITVEGFTYAEYARRGFGELVIVAVSTLGLGLALQTFTRRQSASAVWGFNLLSAVLVGLTSIILASAIQRLLLYEKAYGFTRLRTYPHVFMAWVGVLLGVFLITTVINRPRLFVFGTFLAGLGFVATLNTLNTDAFIARQNIIRQQQTGKLDAAYLATLSDDAAPDLFPLLNNPDEETRNVIGGALHYRLSELDALMPEAGWQGWHWARSRAYTALNRRRAEIEQYEPQQYFWRVPID